MGRYGPVRLEAEDALLSSKPALERTRTRLQSCSRPPSYSRGALSPLHGAVLPP